MGAYFQRLALRSGLSPASSPRGEVPEAPARLDRELELEAPLDDSAESSVFEAKPPPAEPQVESAVTTGTMSTPRSANALEEDEALCSAPPSIEIDAVIEPGPPLDAMAKSAQQGCSEEGGEREFRLTAYETELPTEAAASRSRTALKQENLPLTRALGTPGVESMAKAVPAPRREAARGPSAPRERIAPDVKRTPSMPDVEVTGRTPVVSREALGKPPSIEVRIGAVTVEIHQPNAGPAPLPVTSRLEPRREQRATFSPSRHYLRGD